MALLKVKNDLYRTKTFWLVRSWIESVPLFFILKVRHRIDLRKIASKDSARLLLPTLYPFLKATIYSAIIVLILQSYSHFYPPDPNKFDKNAIDSFLTAVASVSGVFLGLYFTAIASIAGTFLTRATQDVRSFFLSIPTGQQYIQTVAITGIVSIFYLFTKSFGYTINPVGLIFLALLAAYIIIRFWVVGSHVYNSMEPNAAMPWISKDTLDAIKGAASPGFRWDKPVMQNHQRRIAAYQLELTHNLIKFGVREIKLSDAQLLIALRYIGGLLFAYADQKKKIPTESNWYETKIQSENWAFADSTKILLAMNTGTVLQPKTIKDATWFEEQLFDIALYVLKLFADSKRDGDVNLSSAFQGIEVFVSVGEIYGDNFDVAAAQMLTQKLEHMTPLVYAITPAEDEPQERKEQIAFVDSQGRFAISLLLGLMKYLDKNSADGFSTSLSKIDWASRAGIYSSDLPSTTLSCLESIATDLRNEDAVEGSRVSTDWYIRTLVAQRYLFSLQKYFVFVKSLHDDYFEKKLSLLLTGTGARLDLAVHVIQRWLEFTEKYGALVRIMQKHVEGFSGFQQVKDLPWPKFDFTEEEKIANTRRAQITDRLIMLLPRLQSLVTGDDLPDYFGQALTLGVQSCYEACEDNDTDRLTRLFPFVFVASLSAYDRVREKVQNWSEEESKIIYATEPLANLFEISGYAKLYADLYQNPQLWQVAESAWNTYLSGLAEPHSVLEHFAAVANYRGSVFKIMPGATLRSNWQIRFGHKMEELGLQGFPFGRDSLTREATPIHPSALIRVISRWGGLTAFSAAAVFFVTYLSVQPAAEGIEFPDRHDLSELITREEQTPDEDEDDD